MAFLDAVKGGKGFIGTHSATDTFHTDNESKKGPDRYKNHGAQADTYVRMRVAEVIKPWKKHKARQRSEAPNFAGFTTEGEGCGRKGREAGDGPPR